MIFLETSFLINFFLDEVQNHERALELMKKMKDKEKIISEMVIYETLTVLRKLKQNNNEVKRAYKTLTKLTVLDDQIYYKQALDYTLHQNNIGFFDNLSYQVMKNNQIKKILSFDSDFDIFKNITRIH